MKKLLLFSISFAFLSCSNNSEDDLTNGTNTNQITKYTQTIKPIIDNNCVSCHGATNPSAGLSLTNYTEVKNAVLNNNLLNRVNSTTSPMPQSGKMPQATVDLILDWNADGLLE